MKISKAFLNAYVRSSKLGGHKNLHGLFPPQVQEVLVEDRALRHVFLLVLPEKELGELHIKNLPSSVDRTLLERHSGFLVGNDSIASLLASRGEELVVGVVDTPVEDDKLSIPCTGFQGAFKVANGRTASFPLSDGSWLGVKGSGQYQDKDKAPFFLEDDNNGMYIGLVKKADLFTTDLIPTASSPSPICFNQMLGHRALYAIPDGMGNLIETKMLADDEGKISPQLVFSRTVHPHRLNKFPHLLSTDPGLAKITRRVSAGIEAFQTTSSTAVPRSPAELMLFIAETIGITEGFKHANNWYRRTIHSQDFNFAGQQAIDSFEPLPPTEVFPHHTFIPVIHRKVNVYTVLINVISQLSNYAYFEDNRPQYSSLFPDPLGFLKAFISGYFSQLRKSQLTLLKTLAGSSRTDQHWEEMQISHIFGGFPMESFLDPKYHDLANKNIEMRKDVYDFIFSWLQDELIRRTA